jgi:hypothetical protein
MALQQAANTCGNSRQWTNSVNTGVGASIGYQQATILRTGQISGYGDLSTLGQQQIAAQGDTVDLNDSVTTSNMRNCWSAVKRRQRYTFHQYPVHRLLRGNEADAHAKDRNACSDSNRRRAGLRAPTIPS